MDRWEIRPTPIRDDPDRHLLLLQGGPTDVAALLKKFGALFGRPTPYQEEGFNLSFVLHHLTPDVRTRLDSWLRKFAPASDEPQTLSDDQASVSVAPPHEFSAPPPAQSAAAQPEIPPLVPLSPEPATQGLPPASGEATMAGLQGLFEMPASDPLAAPASAPAPVPEAVAPPVPVPAPVEPPAPAARPAPAAPEPVAQVATAPSAPPPEQPFTTTLRPDWTMETLLVGAYNRFAHAAATSVVSSPGTMYNPLFLYGVPGTGKSHLLHAIGSALSKGLGNAVIFATSGPRLSRGVNAGMARGSLAEMERKAAESKALLVDDLHLMAVSDQNKDTLSRIFKAFLDRHLQVVITSLYPPRALGALEEALKFSFSKGWSVDLKAPSPAAQKELIAAAADRLGGKFAVDEIALMHEKLAQWGYQDLALWLRRLLVFKAMREAAGQPASAADLLPLIYEPVLAGAPEPPRSPVSFQPPPPGLGAASLAVVVPKDQQWAATFAASMFHDVGVRSGFRQSYRHAAWETYDIQQPFGVPFLIGELCHRAGVTRALVVGPPPDSPLGPRSAEFAHAVRRILESLGVEMGWLPFNGLALPAHYLNAHLDFASPPAG